MDKGTSQQHAQASGTSELITLAACLHCVIKYKKQQFQYDLYPECGFLHLIMQCIDPNDFIVSVRKSS
eukprot:2543381-Rhodomonas_salina.2